MNANELRIGNYVNAPFYDKPIIVHSVCSINEDIFNRTTGEIPIHSLSPIPLTVEILLKCGFEIEFEGMDMYIPLPIGDSLELHIDSITEYDFINASITKGKKKGGIPGKDYQYFYLSECEHLHQLQNLYFALTNTELKIEL